jgi:DNA adenine methylase
MEEETHLAPPLCRVGSKRRFAELLTHILPPHTTYVEPFAGSAAIFFYKKPAQREVLNDLDKHVTGIFKTIQKVSGDAVFPNIDTMEKAQAYHTHTYTKPEDILTQYLIRSCSGWMGKTVPEGNKLMRLQNPLGKLKHIKEYKARLRGVHITNEDYEKVIKDNDSASTVFFMDPPYESSIGLTYAKGSNRFDFDRFAKVVSDIRGKWLITINDSPYIRGLFKEFIITPVLIVGHHRKTGHANTTRTIGTDDRPELLISNYPLPKDVKEFAPKNLRFKGGMEYQMGDARKERDRLDNEEKAREVLGRERKTMEVEDANVIKRRDIIGQAVDSALKLGKDYDKALTHERARFITSSDKRAFLEVNTNLQKIYEWFLKNLDEKEAKTVFKKNTAGIDGIDLIKQNIAYLNERKAKSGWGEPMLS